MENLKLASAYSRYGAKVPRGQQTLSAIADRKSVV